MLNCTDIRGRLDPYLDGELGMDENVQVVRHLEQCPPCAAVFDGERLLFDEVRRQAAGPAAPPGLRDLIASRLGAAKVAARPWPFARAIVPAAAAALLVALFVTFLTNPVEAETLARRAVAWHNANAAQEVPVSTAPEIEKFYAAKGIKSCTHERTVKNALHYEYKSVCVEESGPAGGETSWWVARCPQTGCKVSHACFAAPPGLEKVWPERERRVVRMGGKAVVMIHRRGEICLLVFDNCSEADRYGSLVAGGP